MKEFVISEAKAESAILVGLITKDQDEAKTKEYLDELEFLADTAGAVTVKRYTQRVGGPSQTTYVGKGKLEEIRNYIKEREDAEEPVGMVIFDDELSARQIRNIEKELGEEDPRPHQPHPRHLCHARPDGQRQDAGGVGAVSLHAAAPPAPLDPPGAPRRWIGKRWRQG